MCVQSAVLHGPVPCRAVATAPGRRAAPSAHARAGLPATPALLARVRCGDQAPIQQLNADRTRWPRPQRLAEPLEPRDLAPGVVVVGLASARLTHIVQGPDPHGAGAPSQCSQWEVCDEGGIWPVDPVCFPSSSTRPTTHRRPRSPPPRPWARCARWWRPCWRRRWAPRCTCTPRRRGSCSRTPPRASTTRSWCRRRTYTPGWTRRRVRGGGKRGMAGGAHVEQPGGGAHVHSCCACGWGLALGFSRVCVCVC